MSTTVLVGTTKRESREDRKRLKLIHDVKKWGYKRTKKKAWDKSSCRQQWQLDLPTGGRTPCGGEVKTELKYWIKFIGWNLCPTQSCSI